MSRKFIGIAAAVAGAIIIVSLAGMQASFVRGNSIARGVHVAGVDLSGCTTGAAAPGDGTQRSITRLAAWSHVRGQAPISFSVNGRTWTGKLADVGVVPDVKAMEAEALSIGRTGSAIRRVFEQFGISSRGKNLPALYKIDRDRLSDVLAKIDKAVCEPARDAQISFVDGIRSVTPEVYGSTVDSGVTYKHLQETISRGLATVDLAVTTKTPSVTTADLQKVDTVLASFTTVYPGWKRERTHNIKLAVASVNSEMVRPGKTFSYNKAVGPRLKKFGFEDALVYENGKIIPGTGGGICQVSTTLYNTVLLAGLRVTERSNHSMRVPYVPLGRDATVAYGLRDLKFINTTSAPIYISAYAARSRLTISIYGDGSFKKEVRIVTTRPKKIVRSNGKTITAVTVYRVLCENGVEVSRERVSSDRYNPAPPHGTPTPAPAPKPENVAKTGGQG